MYSNLNAKGFEFFSVLDSEEGLWETQINDLKGL